MLDSPVVTLSAFTQSERLFIFANATPLADRLDKKLVPHPSARPEVMAANLNQWEQVVAPTAPDQFARRIEQLGYDKVSIQSWLDQVQFGENVQEEAWWSIFDELMDWYANPQTTYQYIPETGTFPFPTMDAPFPFQELWLAAVHYFTDQLRQKAGKAFDHLSPLALSSLQQALLRKLFILSSEVLLVEFGIFRHFAKSKLSLLFEKKAGVYSDDAYQQFIQWHLDRGLRKLFLEYPVLARLITTVGDQWATTNAAFLTRWDADYTQVGPRFFSDSVSPRLTQLSSSLSDSHRGGQMVIILTLENGHKLVYKPRSLACEAVWNDMLTWTNTQTDLSLKTLVVWDRMQYGWMEFITYQPGRQLADASRFYRRAGALLALGYILGSSDFHYENLIASGDQPVIIDLETITHHSRKNKIVYEGELDVLMNQVFGESVVRTGMLPRWISGDDGKAVDVSALGSVTAQSTRVKMPIWNHINTDHMERVMEFKTAEPGANVFKVDTIPANPNLYLSDLLDGFTVLYTLIEQQQVALMDGDSPLMRLADQSVRFIFRPTYRYYMTLHQALNANCMRNGALRSIWLDNLATDLVQSPLEHTPAWPLLALEHKAMEREDCPYFAGPASGKTLESEGAIVNNLIEKDCYTQLIDRLRSLSSKDLQKQHNYIQASFDARNDYNQHTHTAPAAAEAVWNDVAGLDQANDEILLNAAIAIGNQICETILESEGNSSWVTLKYIPPIKRHQLAAIGPDLFEGNTGVALFLAGLGAALGNATYKNMALEAIKAIRTDLTGVNRTIIADSVNLHGVTGLAGILYGLSTIANLTGSEALKRETVESLSLFTPERFNQSSQADVLSGLAGTILCLLAVYQHTGSPLALALSEQCGKKLLADRVLINDQGWGWKTFEDKMITGFAHGLAGIACALHRLGMYTGDPAYKVAAEETVRLENKTFSPNRGNWPDLRWTKDDQAEPDYADGWCHGAPGIGLSRLEMLSDSNPSCAFDVQAAVAVLQQASLDRVDHLCCGSTGRLAILHEIGLRAHLPLLQEESRQKAVSLIRRATKKQEYSLWWSPYHHVSLPGLFQGTSGIGYSFLRLMSKTQLPNILLLQP